MIVTFRRYIRHLERFEEKNTINLKWKTIWSLTKRPQSKSTGNRKLISQRTRKTNVEVVAIIQSDSDEGSFMCLRGVTWWLNLVKYRKKKNTDCKDSYLVLTLTQGTKPIVDHCCEFQWSFEHHSPDFPLIYESKKLCLLYLRIWPCVHIMRLDISWNWQGS